MSTRAVVEFAGDDRAPMVYVHSNGYPAGLGLTIKHFLGIVQRNVPDTRFTDPGYLAAKFVVYMAAIHNANAQDNRGQRERCQVHPLEFLSVGIVSQVAGDVAFVYRVRCDVIGGDGLPVVECRGRTGALVEIGGEPVELFDADNPPAACRDLITVAGPEVA